MMQDDIVLVGKHFTRKESTDSGISAGSSSRKTSTTSSISTGGILEEPSEETIKEETPFSEPDDDLCEKITQQVGLCRTLNWITLPSFGEHLQTLLRAVRVTEIDLMYN